MSGAAIVTGSLVASGFSQSSLVLALTYGVSAGLAMSMLLSTAEIILNEYFDKRMSLASGIMFSGTRFWPPTHSSLYLHFVKEYLFVWWPNH